MNYPSQNIKAITDFIFIGEPAENLAPSDLVIVLGNHIIDIMMGEVAVNKYGMPKKLLRKRAAWMPLGTFLQ